MSALVRIAAIAVVVTLTVGACALEPSTPETGRAAGSDGTVGSVTVPPLSFGTAQVTVDGTGVLVRSQQV